MASGMVSRVGTPLVLYAVMVPEAELLAELQVVMSPEQQAVWEL